MSATQFVALNVVRKSGPGDCGPGIRARSSAPLEGSLFDLRQILVEDEVIHEDDKFYVDGRAIGRTAEAHIKWTDILRVSNLLLSYIALIDEDVL